ncbi:MAG: radical SAM protein [Desulfobacteraceae bacterium]|nr:MAG: radical SAM protein [Desulfobacteraceae bacterium]
MTTNTPAYIALGHAALRAKAELASENLRCCGLCPRRCKTDRTGGQTGYCRTAARAVVASYDAHYGEEAPLVGSHGSGTIFFSHCNLLCNFCQNFDISHEGAGRRVSERQLADMMLDLQDNGCHNINLVTPSHVIPQILGALVLAAADGLTLPLVYNSSAYDAVESLRLLEGVVDIYMPDFKFWNPIIAAQTCKAPDYPEVARTALIEMHRQVGDLIIDDDGLTRRGLLVRHLVLPEGLAGTRDIARFIATQISDNTYINIMAQYRPCGRAHEISALARSLSALEYERALNEAREEGIGRLDQRRRVFMIR